jgi:methyl-accepting chemotaxis protein
MNLLKNAKISVKVATIVVALSFVSIGFVVYLTQTMKSIDAQYAELLNNRSQGLVWASRADRRIYAMGYAAYKAMSYDGSSTESKEAVGERRRRGFQSRLPSLPPFANGSSP